MLALFWSQLGMSKLRRVSGKSLLPSTPHVARILARDLIATDDSLVQRVNATIDTCNTVIKYRVRLRVGVGEVGEVKDPASSRSY